jgi:hypothetical protein
VSGRGSLGLYADRGGADVLIGLPQGGDVVEAVEQRNNHRVRDCGGWCRLQAFVQSGGLGRHPERVDTMVQLGGGGDLDREGAEQRTVDLDLSWIGGKALFADEEHDVLPGAGSAAATSPPTPPAPSTAWRIYCSLSRSRVWVPKSSSPRTGLAVLVSTLKVNRSGRP